MHSWNLSPAEAVAMQNSLRGKIRLDALGYEPKIIAGADISFNLYSNVFYAGIILLKFPELTPVARSLAVSESDFPYIPGLLSFRETPSLLKAWEQIPEKPDLAVLDGQGIAHPRRFGIACHFSLLANVPAIGCAKSLLTGKYTEPATEAGSKSPIRDGEEIIGYALRTKNKVNPVFVSPGNRISFDEALDITMRCVTKYRIPEPTRLAHNLVNAFRKGELEAGFSAM